MALTIHSLLACVALCLLSLSLAHAFNVARSMDKQPQLVGFSWKNCGPSSDPVQVKSLAVHPDPIKIPGNITVSTSFTITKADPTDTALQVYMEKKVGGFWVKIPCIQDVGSCNYGDLCKNWAEVCPKYFEKFGIPCTCPIPPNTYTIPEVDLDVSSRLPPGAKGELRITANLISPSAGHLGCVQLDINLN